MKIALLIICHKNFEQINLFLDTIRHPAFTCFIHADKKTNITDCIMCRDDVVILPIEYRTYVQWGTISLVDASLNLLLFSNQFGQFDFFWICSGQDFPIKPINEIVLFFEQSPDNDYIQLTDSKNFGTHIENAFDKRNAIYYPKILLGKNFWKKIVRRIYIYITGGNNRTFHWARRTPVNGLSFFYGSEWFCISKRTLSWIFAYLDTHPEYYQFMRNSNCPDESFFQTLIMQSPFAYKRKDYLHYIDWSEGKNSPKTLNISDLARLKASNMLMARKFDSTLDSDVLIHLSAESRLMDWSK